MTAQPTPFTVLGGFLGAGKTTLLNRILSEASATRYAVLVNDFGKINIDASLITQHDGQTLTLSNGCICCSLADGFISTVLSLMQRRDEFDHIIVEASGVSEPQRIMDIARLDPELHADAILVLVDSHNLPHQLCDPALNAVIESQIRCADVLLFNKMDLTTDVQLRQVRSDVDALNSRATKLFCTHAMVPIEIVTGIELRSSYTLSTSGADNINSHSHNKAQLNSTAVLKLYSASAVMPSVGRQDFQRFCDALPASVIRGKGLIKFNNEQSLWRWHKVADQQSLTEHETDNTRVDNTEKTQPIRGQLVLIGTNDALIPADFAHLMVEVVETHLD